MTGSILSIVMLCAVTASAQGGFVVYVDEDAAPGGNGYSWNTAFRCLQDAMAMASSTSEIRVGPGIYRPDESDYGHAVEGNPAEVIEITSELIIRGGYAGVNAPDPDLHDPSVYQTVLSGDLNEDDGPDFTNMSDNSSRLIHVHNAAGPVRLEGLIIRSAYHEDNAGGGLRVRNTHSLYLDDCSFEHCIAGIGSSAHISQTGHVEIRNCGFNSNRTTVAVAGMFLQPDSFLVADCVFRNNHSDYLWPGALAAHPMTGDGLIVNCEFVSNSTPGGPGAGLQAARCTIANSVFYRNQGSGGAGAFASLSTVVNCVFYENIGGGLSHESSLPTSAINCIFWNNQGGQLADFPLDGHVSYPDVSYSCVQGGWSGTSNIDADPMFVQPGTRNFRLAHGSPCLNVASYQFLPADTFDLDNDGNTAERLPIDITGANRVQGGSVDMGAYEGSFDPLPPATMNDDLDPGESVFLTTSNEYINVPYADRTEAIVVFVQNLSDQFNATVVATDMRDPAGRAAADSPLVEIESSIPPDQLLIRASVPFTTADLNGGDPLEVNMTVHDTSQNYWPLAAARNAINSPGHTEPVGDRYIVQSPNQFQLPSEDPGDYGVYWNEDIGRGYVWAAVDKQGHYGLRLRTCPGDAAPYTGDRKIDLFDLLEAIKAWGTDSRWSDADDSGVVDLLDVGMVIDAWGICGD